MEHFGLKISEGVYGYKINKESYSKIKRKSTYRKGKGPGLEENGLYHEEEWCRKYQEKVRLNYDLNMEYYKRLSKKEFEKEINKLKEEGFKEIKDLNNYYHVSGYYVMVLDEYKQMYIGTSTNIAFRIKDHWKGQKPFDRLLYPIDAVYESRISIDSFRPLDTTRIFVLESNKTYEKEDYYINIINDKFICNRVAGGNINKYRQKDFELYKCIKKRKLG